MTIERRHQRQRQKNSWLRLATQQLCTCITLFVHFFAAIARLRRENTWFHVFLGDINTRQRLSFSFPEFWLSPLEFNVKKKNTSIWQIRRDGISAIKFEAARLFKWRFRSKPSPSLLLSSVIMNPHYICSTRLYKWVQLCPSSQAFSVNAFTYPSFQDELAQTTWPETID